MKTDMWSCAAIASPADEGVVELFHSADDNGLRGQVAQGSEANHLNMVGEPEIVAARRSFRTAPSHVSRKAMFAEDNSTAS